MLKKVPRGVRPDEELIVSSQGPSAVRGYPLGGELVESFVASSFTSSHISAGKLPALPDFFIVGAPRCGTTAMAHYLGQHPEIFMARKELHFFGQDLLFGKRFYRRSLKGYLNEFANRNGERRAGEASVWYLASKTAAQEIHAFNPEARIIIMLREPTEMLHSLYHMFRFDGNEPLKTFEEALDAESERRAGRRLGRGTYLAQGLLYHDAARYTEQVKRYLDIFGRDCVRVILYDDLTANLHQTFDQTLEFLGVNTLSRPREFKVINEHRSIRNKAFHTLLADATLRRLALRVGGWMPQPLFKELQRVEERLWKANTRPARRAPMAPELRARLKFELSDEVQSLSQLLGRDLTHWSR